MVDQIRFFAGAARILEGKSAGEYLADHTSWIRREPVGVIGQVAPWNYPMMMAIWKFCPAIAAGNTVVIKPSDTTPVTTVMLAELAAKHLPPGVLNVVTGDRVTGAEPRRPPDAADGVDHRVGGRGPGRRGQRRRQPQAHPPRAGRQGAGDRLRRRRYRRRRRGHRDRRLLQRRARTARRPPGCWRRASIAADLTAALAEQAKGATTTFGRPADDEDAWVPPVNNVNQMERVLSLLRRRARRTRRSPPAEIGRATRVSTSSRR